MNAHKKVLMTFLGMLLILAIPLAIIWADGTETLGPPPPDFVESGSGIVAAGTGMISQPGTINITVPGTAVSQVLLYWEGQHTSPNGDSTINVNGTPVTGTLIGGPTDFFGSPSVKSSTFRADITNLGLVVLGSNTLQLDGINFNFANNGAGVLVIFDDGSSADIQIRDGNDLAFINFASPLNMTVPQTFNFAPASEPRTADLSMFFSSVSGTISGNGGRPSSIEIMVSDGGPGTTTTLSDLLDSFDGEEWDTVNLSVPIPAGATNLTVQAFSRNDGGGQFDGGLEASFAWNAAALAVLPAACVPPPAGLIHWYPGDGNANDFIGGVDGTLLGGAGFGPGQVGQAFSLDGIDDGVGLGTLDVNGGGGVTIEAWINADTWTGGNGDNRVFSKATGVAESAHWIMLSGFNSGGPKLRARLKTNGTTTTHIATSGTVSPGTWHHVALTYDGSRLKMYLNGGLVLDDAKSGPVAADNTVQTQIGRNPSSKEFDGRIDELSIYNVALTASQIQAIFNAGTDGKCKDVPASTLRRRPTAKTPTILPVQESPWVAQPTSSTW